MNKTINVTLANLVFSLDEDAYASLSAYLESLKAHFASLSYGSEVMADIESRIAEDFTAKAKGIPNRAISLSEVEEIIKSIGTVEDIAESNVDAGTQPAESKSATKRLYRNTDDVIIAGVGSGIAAYFGIDTLLVRVILAVTVLAGGWGILLYILLWLLLPEAKSSSQKLEMKGAPVTIKQIEQTAKDKISEVKASSAGRKLVKFIGQIIKWFARVILIIIGAGITLGAGVATIATAFTAANLFFNRNSPYIDLPISSVFTGTEYFFAILLGFIAIIIPLIFLALGGLTLIRIKKPPVNGMLAFALAVIWVVAAVGTSVIAFNKAPAIQAAAEQSRGNVETRTLEAVGFTRIDASSIYKINVTPGKNYAVSVTGHTRDLDLSKFSVEQTTLTFERKSKVCFFCFDSDIIVNITTPVLESITGSGAVTYSVGTFASPNFSVDLSGASKASIEKITAETVTVYLSGASFVTFTGSGKTLNADISGASRLNSFDFAAENVIAQASGASHVEVNAVKTLSADASGASTITYKGTPVIENQDESGSAQIIPSIKTIE